MLVRMHTSELVLTFLVLAIVGSVLSRKIDLAGGLVGGGITYVLYLAIGWVGIMLIGSFFGLGTAASLWKLQRKQAWGVAEEHNVRRGWRNVIGNAGVAGAIAVLLLGWPDYAPLGRILIASCFAAALSDTWSSELGTVYGTRFYQVLTGKSGQRGQDGVVSGAGSLAGVAGSALMAGLFALFHGWGSAVAITFVAGIVGNLTDSLLGASLERAGRLNNHAVNFLATLLAALFALGLFFGEKLLQE